MGRRFRFIGTTSAVAVGMIAAADPAAAQQQRQPYDIAPGDLKTTLGQFEARSGRVVVLDGVTLDDRSSPGVSGTFSEDQALRRMLSGSGLKACTGDGRETRIVASRVRCSDRSGSGQTSASGDIIVTANSVSHLAASNRTGTRMDADPMTLPMAVSTVSEELIQKQQAFSLADAVANVAGVTPGPDGSFSLRGFSTGFMRNGDVSATATSDDLPIIAIDRLEVVKGPEAIIAGTTVGYGGVVNVLTKTAQARPTFEVMGTTGTRGYRDLGLDIGGAINADRSVMVRVVASTQDQTRNFSGYDGSFDDYVSPSAAFHHPTLGTDVSLQYEYQRIRRAPNLIAYTDGPKLTDDLPIPKLAPDDYGTVTRFTRATVNVVQPLVRGWTVTGRFSRENRKRLALSEGTGDLGFGNVFPERDTLLFRGETQAITDFWKAELRGKFETGPVEHSLLLAYDDTKVRITQGNQLTGIQISNVETNAVTDLTPTLGPALGVSAPQPPNGLDPHETGLLVLDQMRWGDLNVVAGYREIRYVPNYRFATPAPVEPFKRNLPSLGILYRVTDSVSVYASAARGFQPNLGQYGVGGVTIPPEDANQYEAGLKTLLFDKKLAATFSLYRIDQSNVSIPDPDQLNPVCNGGSACYISVPGLRSTGFEAEVSGTIAGHLELRATYSYNDKNPSQQGDGSSGISYARHLGTLWATYNFDKAGQGFWLGGNVQARSERVPVDSFDLINPGQVRVDLSGGYDADRFQIIGGIKNVLDTRLYAVSSGGSGMGAVDQTREWYLTARFRFL